MVAAANFIFVLILALIPSIVWLIFFLKEDLHPEPRRLILYVFSLGALISVPILIIQLLFQKFVAGPLNVSILLILGLALIEEILKFFVVYWGVGKEPTLDEPVDAMIYTITAALGFATIENIFIIGDRMSYLTLGNVFSAVSILGFRFIGATLLHGLASAFAGYYWALGRKLGQAKKFIPVGLAVAVSTHFIFNLAIYRFENVNMFYPSLFLVFTALFVFKDFSKLKSQT